MKYSKGTVLVHPITFARVEVVGESKSGKSIKVKFLSVGKGNRTGLLETHRLEAEWRKVE